MNQTILTDHLNRLDAAALIALLDRITQTYGFRHALLQESAYESTLRSDRRELHRQVAQAYERLYGERAAEYAALLAHHYAQAGDHVQIVKYATLAGDAAFQRFAYPEARLNYTLALQSLSHLEPSDDNRRLKVDVLLNEVTVSFMARDPAVSLAHLREADAALRAIAEGGVWDSTDRRRRVLLHFLTGRAHLFLSENGQALDAWRLARAEAQKVGDETLCSWVDANIGRLLSNQGRFGEARRILEPTLAALAATEQWREWALAAPNLGLAIMMQGDVQAGIAHCEAALQRAADIGFATGVMNCRFMLSLICLLAGDPQRSLAESRAVLELAEAAHDYGFMYWALGLQAWAAYWLGQREAAARSLSGAAEAGRQLGPGYFLRDLLLLIEAEVAQARGHTSEALALIEQSLSIARAGGYLLSEGYALRLRARVLHAHGPDRTADAIASLEASLAVLQIAEAPFEIARTRALLDRMRSTLSA